MLIEFSVTNWRSFRDRATLDLRASSDDWLEVSNVAQVGGHRLLRSAVLYGANASGKSNLLEALRFMRHVVLQSSKDSQAHEGIRVKPFLLDAACGGKPSRFEAVFLLGGSEYRYGFEVDRTHVHSEWLRTRGKAREATCFTREIADIRANLDRFGEGAGLEGRTRANALYLSVCAQFNGPLSMQLLAWFRGLEGVPGSYGQGSLDATALRLTTPADRARALKLVTVADPSITDLGVERTPLKLQDLPEDMPDGLKRELLGKMPEIVELKATHRTMGTVEGAGAAVVFDVAADESAGTRQVIALAGPILDALENGRVIVADELDARLHPLLTEHIVSLFHSPANRANAQLIFASHDTHLLSPKRFRRDQLWLTEKDEHGASQLYSLSQIRGVRKDAALERDYILGKYGAIPFIGDPDWLLCDQTHG